MALQELSGSEFDNCWGSRITDPAASGLTAIADLRLSEVRGQLRNIETTWDYGRRSDLPQSSLNRKSAVVFSPEAAVIRVSEDLSLVEKTGYNCRLA